MCAQIFFAVKVHISVTRSNKGRYSIITSVKIHSGELFRDLLYDAVSILSNVTYY
jgi:hypothetical protein